VFSLCFRVILDTHHKSIASKLLPSEVNSRYYLSLVYSRAQSCVRLSFGTCEIFSESELQGFGFQK